MGASKEAAQLWDALVATAPQHPRALFIAGKRRVESGDALTALGLLAKAEELDPNYPEIPLCTAVAHRMLGALPAALQALDRALARDPYFFMALLWKGAVLERMGKPRLAATLQRDQDRAPARAIGPFATNRLGTRPGACSR